MIELNAIPRRCWINQPSTLQPLHALNGEHVLAIADTNGRATIYFLSGPTISSRIDPNCLSAGWPHPRKIAS
jgi:hypothetical protein